jgi:hypothetical protein
MVHGWTWRRLAIGCRQFVAVGLSDAQLQQASAQQVAQRANQPQLDPALQAKSAQTTIGGWLALNAAPMQACRIGSVLFCLDGTQGVKHQLNDAVVLKWAECDQFRRSCDNDPECRMMEKVHAQRCGRASSVATRCSTPLSLLNVSLRSCLMSI